MSKDIREKEIELFNKWCYLKELSKDDKIKKQTTFELQEAENELFNKWKFYKGFLNAKGGMENENKIRKIK